MPGPEAYWCGKEELEAAIEGMRDRYLFRYGNESSSILTLTPTLTLSGRFLLRGYKVTQT